MTTAAIITAKPSPTPMYSKSFCAAICETEEIWGTTISWIIQLLTVVVGVLVSWMRSDTVNFKLYLVLVVDTILELEEYNLDWSNETFISLIDLTELTVDTDNATVEFSAVEDWTVVNSILEISIDLVGVMEKEVILDLDRKVLVLEKLGEGDGVAALLMEVCNSCLVNTDERLTLGVRSGCTLLRLRVGSWRSGDIDLLGFTSTEVVLLETLLWPITEMMDRTKIISPRFLSTDILHKDRMISLDQ